MNTSSPLSSVADRISSIEARFGARPPVAAPRTVTSSGSPSGSPSFSSLVNRLVSSSSEISPDTASSVTDLLGAVLERDRPVAVGAQVRTTVDADVGGMGSLAGEEGTSSAGEEVVQLASHYLGVPYVWGGEDPTGFDCSGLIQHVYGQLGIDIPRVSRDQARIGVGVSSLDHALPGDLVAFGNPVDHIGIYAGGGNMVVAPHTGDVVKVQKIGRAPTAIRRVLEPDTASVDAASRALDLSAPDSGITGDRNDAAASYRSIFAEAEARYGVSADLLEAVAKQESGFNPDAVSPAGAQGLMQLMPATARALKVDAFDPAAAVDGSARLLGQHLRRFGSVPLALAAYNAGPGAVERFGGVPPYRETQGYVTKIMADLAGPGPGTVASLSTPVRSLGRLVSAPMSLSPSKPLFSDSSSSPAASALASLTSSPSATAAATAATTAATATATATTATTATTPVKPAAPPLVTVPQPTMVASTTLGAPGFTMPEGKLVSPVKGAWGPSTQTQVTSVGGSGTVSWLEAGLLDPASPADVAAIVSSAKGPVAKGVLKILQNATAAQLISPEFRQTLNDVNRDALGLPDAPDVIPVQPPPAPAPSATGAAAPAASAATPTSLDPSAATPTTLARPLPMATKP